MEKLYDVSCLLQPVSTAAGKAKLKDRVSKRARLYGGSAAGCNKSRGSKGKAKGSVKLGPGREIPVRQTLKRTGIKDVTNAFALSWKTRVSGLRLYQNINKLINRSSICSIGIWLKNNF